MKSKWNRMVWCWLMAAAFLTGRKAGGSEQKFPADSPAPIPQAGAPLTPMSQLAWEVDRKQMLAKEGQTTAEFTFGVTNISDSEVVIDHVTASCSCTVAKLPSQPWHLAPGTNSKLEVTVDLKGKVGEFEKTLTVFFAGKDVQPKFLRVAVKMPDRKIMRQTNMKLAQADRQAVFKNDCAKCHAEPAKTKSGMALYHDICGICHEAKPRASMVPELRLLPHPTDYTFWKTMIANGKPGTLMPAFAASQGGPLTDEQIDALAKEIEAAFPYSRFGGHPPQAVAMPPSPDTPVLDATAPLPKN